jgi:hypothetical protein
MSRTSEIVIERDELIVVRRREQVVIAFCETCDEEVEMLPPEIAAVVSGAGARELYRLVEAGQIHFTEDITGLLRICARSLGEAVSSVSSAVNCPSE